LLHIYGITQTKLNSADTLMLIFFISKKYILINTLEPQQRLQEKHYLNDLFLRGKLGGFKVFQKMHLSAITEHSHRGLQKRMPILTQQI